MNELEDFKEVPITKKVAFAGVFIFVNMLVAVLVSRLLDWYFIPTLFLLVMFWMGVITLVAFWEDAEKKKRVELERKKRGY